MQELRCKRCRCSIDGDDVRKIAKEFVGAAKGMLSSAAMRAVSEVAEIALGAEGTTQLANKAFGVAVDLTWRCCLMQCH